MEQVSINKNMKLSQHFSLGELTKSNHPEVYNIPSHTAIENLKRICENWLEDLRYSYNMLYVHTGVRPLAGGAKTSNHLSGCAVDIRCAGKEQMIRYASILLDIADGTRQEFDELLLEQHGNVCWLHFAVKPKDNRRRIEFLKA